jgi:rare lipoprotein A
MKLPRRARHLRAGAAIALWALTLAGCATVTHHPSPRPLPPVPAPPPPANVGAIPDAVPRAEPKSLHGNPPFYEVYGQRYYVLATADGYAERGVASWYGPNFHGANTSSGEPYDMYGMTAAHKTLPLPCYARVTNLRNGRSIVVRINDRGPFVANRLIDLSYTAAAKLDMLRDGTTLVEVRTLAPGAPLPASALVAPTLTAAAATAAAPAGPAAIIVAPEPTAVASGAPQDLSHEDTVASAVAAADPPPPALYVQAGAFAEPKNAQRTLERLERGGVTGAFVAAPAAGGSSLYRVRVGPVHSVAEFDALASQLASLGFPDSRLASD